MYSMYISNAWYGFVMFWSVMSRVLLLYNNNQIHKRGGGMPSVRPSAFTLEAGQGQGGKASRVIVDQNKREIAPTDLRL